jgi:hypothetical protein
MTIRHTYTAVAAVVVMWATVGPGVRIVSAQGDSHKMAVTAVGCVQSERQYRRDHESSKFAGTGAGLSNEYVLIDAVVGGPALNVTPVSEQESNCAAGGSGQAIELKGHGESALASMLGRRVMIQGMLLHAKHEAGPVGTSGTFTPAPTGGGFDPLGQDLDIRELEVQSASLVPIATPVKREPVIFGATEPPAEAPKAAVAPAPEAAPETPAQTPAPTLPQTASRLPEIGLIGLVSLTCGVIAALFDRRRSRA